jgi:hypothetical protein
MTAPITLGAALDQTAFGAIQKILATQSLLRPALPVTVGGAAEKIVLGQAMEEFRRRILPKHYFDALQRTHAPESVQATLTRMLPMSRRFQAAPFDKLRHTTTLGDTLKRLQAAGMPAHQVLLTQLATSLSRSQDAQSYIEAAAEVVFTEGSGEAEAFLRDAPAHLDLGTHAIGSLDNGFNKAFWAQVFLSILFLIYQEVTSNLDAAEQGRLVQGVETRVIAEINAAHRDSNTRLERIEQLLADAEYARQQLTATEHVVDAISTRVRSRPDGHALDTAHRN